NGGIELSDRSEPSRRKEGPAIPEALEEREDLVRRASRQMSRFALEKQRRARNRQDPFGPSKHRELVAFDIDLDESDARPFRVLELAVERVDGHLAIALRAPGHAGGLE